MNSENGLVLPVVKQKVTFRTIIITTLAVIFTVSALGCCIALIVTHGLNTVIDVNVTEVCLNQSCFYSSAKLAAMRDVTADPCENFYNYACGKFYKCNLYLIHSSITLIIDWILILGIFTDYVICGLLSSGNWQKYEPESSIKPDEWEKTMFHLMESRNERNLQKMLDTPARVSDKSYEKKMKAFYTSCVDDYGE